MKKRLQWQKMLVRLVTICNNPWQQELATIGSFLRFSTLSFHIYRGQSCGIQGGRTTGVISGEKEHSIRKANRGNVDSENSECEFLSFDHF